MQRVPIVLFLIASLLIAGCASHRPPVQNDPNADVEADAEKGRWSPDHPFCTHARWVQPEWGDDHPVANCAGAVALCVGLCAGFAAVGFGYAYLHSRGHGSL